MIEWVEWTPGLFMLQRDGHFLEPKHGLYRAPFGLWSVIGPSDFRGLTEAEAEAYLADPAVFLMEQVL